MKKYEVLLITLHREGRINIAEYSAMLCAMEKFDPTPEDIGEFGKKMLEGLVALRTTVSS